MRLGKAVNVLLRQLNADKIAKFLKIAVRSIDDEALQRQYENILAAKDLFVERDTLVKIDVLQEISSKLGDHRPIPARERRHGYPIQKS